jgi:hypothetical protein
MSSPSGEPGRAPSSAGPDSIALVLGLLLLVDLGLSVVMLATDKNLQTNFGASSPYYAHWYGVLVMGLVDLVAALAVFAWAMPMGRNRMPTMVRHNGLTGVLVWSVLAILAMVGIVEAYMQVGFTSASQFAHYLFGTTPYPGALSYIPWLYDLLLGMYVLTAIVAAAAVWRARSVRASPGRSGAS